jgi:hypothetical protein
MNLMETSKAGDRTSQHPVIVDEQGRERDVERVLLDP